MVTNDRREYKRLSLQKIEHAFRHCDITIHDRETKLEATIENISPKGVRLALSQGHEVSIGDVLYFNGCVFNDYIGFIARMEATVIWVNHGSCGATFHEPLPVEAEDLQEIAYSRSELISDYHED